MLEVRRGDRADDAVAEEMPGDAAGTEARAEKKIHKVDFWMREERTTRSTSGVRKGRNFLFCIFPMAGTTVARGMFTAHRNMHVTYDRVEYGPLC
jgi:hypothetical protein